MPNTNKYNCDKCNFKCSKKSNYDIHLTTIKHNAYENTYNNAAFHARTNCTDKLYICKCGKTYKHRQSLYTHTKVCDEIHSNDGSNQTTPDSTVTSIPLPPQFDAALVIELLKQNQEFKEIMLEQSRQMAEHQNQMAERENKLIDAVKDGKLGNTNTNCNNNTTNNKFNLNVFLNETCKDAITMDDFIKSFEVTRDDFLHTGKVGYIEGISKVMANRFRDMDVHTRPLHCTDLKRETI